MMIIRWHGHACFEISDGLTIVTDPHDGRSIGIRPPKVKADLVLVSHSHFDHNSVKSVNKNTTKTITEPGVTHLNDFFIQGVPAFHDNQHGERRGEICIFKFRFNDLTFCHLGDLGHIPDQNIIEKLKNIDILFIPIGNVFTIGAPDAWKTIKLLKPKVAIPMHYRVGGLSLSIQPLEPFLANADKVERVGNEIDFDINDLPDNLEVWVFSL